MYDRFTDQAKIVMRLANDEATNRGHSYICPEHIFLAILDNRSGIAAQLVHLFIGDNQRLRHALETIMSERVTNPTVPQAKPLIERTIVEARNLDHSFVGTEHLLLALLQEPAITGALAGLGLDSGVLRK